MIISANPFSSCSASNLAEVLSIFFATLLGFTILKPVHLLWINLITDCFPALALGMEKSEADIMQPAAPGCQRTAFSQEAWDWMWPCRALLVTALTLLSYFIGHYMESGVWEIAEQCRRHDHGVFDPVSGGDFPLV